jgi:hypothetical protein
LTLTAFTPVASALISNGSIISGGAVSPASTFVTASAIAFELSLLPTMSRAML